MPEASFPLDGLAPLHPGQRPNLRSDGLNVIPSAGDNDQVWIERQHPLLKTPVNPFHVGRLRKELELLNRSAVKSLDEGLEETIP